MNRVTLGEVAKAAGVSRATASRALQNNPLIAAATRQRVQDIAARLGYRPDPEASRLLAYLKRSREASFISTIGILNAYSPAGKLRESPYTVRLIKGATDRAAELGYTTNELELAGPGMSPARIDGILRARGIRGLLIPPEPDPLFQASLDWGAISAVATTTTAEPLHLDRVLPHNFSNMALLLDEALARGYRRIGLISWPQLEQRQMMAPTSVYARYAHIEKRFAALPVCPWDFQEGGRNVQRAAKWMLRHKPDLVLGMNETALDGIESATGLRAPADFGFIAYAFHAKRELSRIDERPEVVGAAAIDLLSARILHNETGLPETPKTLLIHGTFVPGTSTR